ncbi:MAG: methylcrotonoyl-CoA carboxylase [Bacteroidetes bacterium]|mgnify:CR=1 FL=1|jgi:3-methylcrotonyl-CoA carboxylase beta subunit|nr:methylcrotonoyl-CoA carboxylase [Bacteroidota bacterium]MAC04135.1 methylcrotonoyl-CoA carboxylase [Balneola sp.]MAO78142.1 methylcrotonoyl-CoA carboxylase [Balneola sp.]MBF64143.1 methylcrotonoyl-CoA carboxylase [Balneola sp.]|tara:strand:- start:14706 stop:16337 length:1632 start_codon:yes stop_codon:yes gene_type:complete
MANSNASKQDNWLNELLNNLRKQEHEIMLGGGQKRIDKEHAKGKLTARERIELLIDNESEFYELGLWAGYEMYEEVGGCPGGGVVTGIGKVEGRDCMIVANDATVKAGAWFPITAKKNLRAQEIAIENHIPLIYLVDSAGVFLPMQDEIFPDKDHFGRMFRNNAVISAKGIPQIAAIMGSCVAGGAYLPIMSDEALIVDGTGSVFLAGSYLVKAAIGETVDNETLGGATTHTEISGVTDYKMKDDQECIATIRDLVGKSGPRDTAGFNRKAPKLPSRSSAEIFEILPESRTSPYDMNQLLECIIDEDSFTEFKKGYGQTIITGYARIDGWSVGIVANQRTVSRTKSGEMQIGGVIYSDSADKAARFIMNCNQKKIPLIFFQDVTGFMIGKRSEHGGIIKDGAKMVNAMSNSTVPKITVVVGNSYGAGNYAMCGRAYDPRFMFAWPTANIAVMSGASAAKTLTQIQIATMKKKGEEVSEEKQNELMKEITDRYNKQTDVRYAASRLWVDAIIHPGETRERISNALECANLNPEIEEFKTGVIQT